MVEFLAKALLQVLINQLPNRILTFQVRIKLTLLLMTLANPPAIPK